MDFFKFVGCGRGFGFDCVSRNPPYKKCQYTELGIHFMIRKLKTFWKYEWRWNWNRIRYGDF